MNRTWLLIAFALPVCADWETVRTLHMRGTLQTGELIGTWESWIDPQHSLFREDLRLGPIRSVSGWNGKVSWSQDQTGDVWIDDSEEALHQASLSAYVDTFAYLFPRRFPAQVTKRRGFLEVAPRGADPIAMWLDPVTHLAGRVKELTGVSRATTVFSDFRKVQDVFVPFERTETGAKPDEVHWRAKTGSVEIDRELPTGIFDPPEATLTQVEFPAGKDSVTVDFRFEGGYIFLPVSVNGKACRNFVFDMGATNAVAARHAKELGLTVQSAGVEYGGGPHAAAAGVTTIGRLEIGELAMVNQAVDTSELPSDEWEGLIGYELARRVVVTIDYAAHRMTFTKPEAFHTLDGAVAVPFRSASRTEILIDAVLDGKRGDFQLDTGDDAQLTVMRPFAERTGLLAKHRNGRKGAVAGIGGQSRTAGFFPSSFEMASFRPLVYSAQIMLARSGSGAEEHVAGLIGNGVLRQFTVTLDYGHRVLYFEKNRDFGKPAGPTTWSLKRGTGQGWLGVSKLKCGSDSCEILAIDPGGLAARKGLAVGDVIRAINGKPVAELSLEETVGAFHPVAGSEPELTTDRAGHPRDVTLRPMY